MQYKGLILREQKPKDSNFHGIIFLLTNSLHIKYYIPFLPSPFHYILHTTSLTQLLTVLLPAVYRAVVLKMNIINYPPCVPWFRHGAYFYVKVDF